MANNYRALIYNDLVRNKLDSDEIGTFADFSRDYFYFPSGDSKRLRQYGLKKLEKYYNSYQVELPNTIKPVDILTNQLIWLQKFCKHLYYIGQDRIVFFNIKEAAIFKLNGARLELLGD